ncbi:MAG: hypothetical protein ACOY3P_21400 [Planctomycetota bacterium]
MKTLLDLTRRIPPAAGGFIRLSVAAIAIWAGAATAAIAQETDAPAEESRIGVWLLAYVLTVLIVVFGMALLLRSTPRRERVEAEFDD